MYPVIMLSGAAGSGKDTAAGYINAICADQGIRVGRVALADPIKRFAYEIFGFTPDQLWGSSDERNAQVTLDWNLVSSGFYDIESSGIVSKAVQHWLSDIGVTEVDKLSNWFWGCYQQGFRNMNVSEPSVPRLLSDRRVLLSPRYVLQTLGTEFGRDISPDVWINAGVLMARRMLINPCIYTALDGFMPDSDPYDLVVITDGRFRNEVLRIQELNGRVFRIHRPVASALGERAQHRSETELNSIPKHFYDAIIANDGSMAKLRQIVWSTLEYYGVISG